MLENESCLFDGEIFQTLRNIQGQYSIWPAGHPIPQGWTHSGAHGSKDHCLAFIEANWLDMRPLALQGSVGVRTVHPRNETGKSRESSLVVETEQTDQSRTESELESASSRLNSLDDPQAFAIRTYTVPDVIEEQAAKTPRAVCLISGEKHLTYAQLDARANRLARLLVREGIGPEGLVALALPRSIDVIVAMLGVLKCGGAYVPLDPNYPPQRLAYMLEDSQPAKIIGTSKTLRALQDVGCDLPPVIRLDDAEFNFRVLAQSDQPLTDSDRISPLLPQNLAYLIYTSGSSGRPKASLHTHENVVNLAWRPTYTEIGVDDTILQFAPLAFDASVFEVWGALFNGARLLLASLGQPDLANLAAECMRHDVSIAWMTAGLFDQAAVSHLPMLGRLRHLIAGGDVLPVQSVRRTLAAHPDLMITNGYGPTETTTFACTHRITLGDVSGGSLPIGSAIRNVQLHVLNGDLSRVSDGSVGELYISGAGLARGYHRRPGLTAERFIACPFGPAGGRMYRTGDLARWRPDSTLEFLGRSDQQLKLRGFRIEPGEIEAALLSRPELVQASVQLCEIAGERRLVAYLVPRRGERVPPHEILHSSLVEALPDYMVPAAFVALAALPLTTNGKLDRRALPSPNQPKWDGNRPTTEIEILLGEIWKELLGLDDIVRTTDFFSIGGHSLLAMKIIFIVEQRFHVHLKTTDLFNAPTIEAFARVIQSAIDRIENTGDSHAAISDTVGDTSDVRDLLKLRLVRPARGVSCGSVLGMPSLTGDGGPVGIIAGNALDSYDVWTFEIDLRPRLLTDSYIWLEVAEEIASRLLTATAPMVKAFVGFSIGAFMAWFVDRMLVAGGRRATPIISFDGGLDHLHFEGWSDRVAPVLERCADSEPSCALLLMRGNPGPFTLIESPAVDWTSATAELQIFCFPTLDHLDVITPAAVAAAREVLREFVETQQIATTSRHELDLRTVGGEAFRLLDAVSPPMPNEVRQLSELSPLPADGTVRLALLLLTMASGDAALALDYINRLLEEEPDHRAAVYAHVAVLSSLGRQAEAEDAFDTWSSIHREDKNLCARVYRHAEEPAPWGNWAKVDLGSDLSLDFAASLLQYE